MNYDQNASIKTTPILLSSGLRVADKWFAIKIGRRRRKQRERKREKKKQKITTGENKRQSKVISLLLLFEIVAMNNTFDYRSNHQLAPPIESRNS